MEREQRLRAFEEMLRAIQAGHADAARRMQRLRAEGKEKTATYRQLMGNRLLYQNMLALYQAHGLLEDAPSPKGDPSAQPAGAARTDVVK